jgi:hypothetical protein
MIYCGFHSQRDCVRATFENPDLDNHLSKTRDRLLLRNDEHLMG